ncbi:MAG: hypothetical protein AAF436_00720 [Myxococcota bacterium]
MTWTYRALVVAVFATCLHSGPNTARADFAEGQPWGLEFGFGWGRTRSSDYIRTLEDFGYTRDSRTGFRAVVAASRRVCRYFEILFQFNTLDDQNFARSAGIGVDDSFKFSTLAFGIHGRAWFPTPNDRFRAYAQLGVGSSVAITRLRTRLSQDAPRTEFRDAQWSYNITSLLGIEGMVSKHVGLFLNGGYVFAPVPKNLFGQRHQSGGGLVLVGISAHFGRTR